MKKFLGVLLVLGLVLTACASKELEISGEELSEKLMEELKFTGDMVEMSEDMVESLYGIDFASYKKVYISDEASAEEVAVFSFHTEEDLEKARDLVEKKLEEDIDSYAEYEPREAKRLEDASIKQAGKTLVLVVSNDENQSKKLDKLMK